MLLFSPLAAHHTPLQYSTQKYSVQCATQNICQWGYREIESGMMQVAGKEREFHAASFEPAYSRFLSCICVISLIPHSSFPVLTNPLSDSRLDQTYNIQSPEAQRECGESGFRNVYNVAMEIQLGIRRLPTDHFKFQSLKWFSCIVYAFWNLE